MDFDPERFARSPWVGGALGAIVALRGAPGATWPARFFNVVCGALIAGYTSPAFAEWAGMHTAAMQSGCAFFFGLFGMNLVAAVTSWIAEAKLADVVPWLNRRKD